MNRDAATYSQTRPIHQLRISFTQRNSGHFVGDDDDGIVTLDCPEQVRETLDEGYPELTSRWGWAPWKNDRIRDVIIRDLGPSLFGLAGLVGRENGQMVISPRPFDPLPELVKLRRRGTVVHELIHLLQFQSPLFQHFYNPARHGAWDPNWWLHEASALAAEVALVPSYPTPFYRLWEWATKPHLSLDTDENGYRALPFLLYLRDNVSEQLFAKLYETQSASVRSMLAVEALALALIGHDRNLSTEFLNYCVAVAPIVNRQSPAWLAGITHVVGPRAFRERFRAYPVQSMHQVPVDHLGCRYFRFKPNGSLGSKLTLRVTNITHPDVLHGVLSVVDEDGQSVVQHRLVREGDQLSAHVDDFSAALKSHAVLTIANCAYGIGWANFDNNRFSLRATLE